MKKFIRLGLTSTSIIAALTTVTSAQDFSFPENDPVEPIGFPIPNPDPNPIRVPVPTVTPSTPDAGETKLRFGIPNKNPNNRLNGFDYSTAEIDAWLKNQNPISLGLADVTLDFGDHYTRDLLNAGFEQVRQEEAKLEQGLAADLIEDVEAVKSVYKLDLRLNPFTIEFKQQGQNVQVDVGKLDGDFVGKVKIPYCGTFKVRGNVRDASASAKYNWVNGRRPGLDVSADIGGLKISTGNPLKAGCLAIGSFGVALGLIELPSFSSSDFLEGMNDGADMDDNNVRNANDILRLSQAFIAAKGPLPIQALEEGRQDGLNAIKYASGVINDPNFQGSGVQVNFKYEDAEQNEISLIVSHNSSTARPIEYGRNFMDVHIDSAPNTRRHRLYYQPQYGSGYIFLAEGTGNYLFSPIPPNGSKLVVISESNLISGLWSLPKASGIVRSPFQNCQPNCPELY